MEEEQKGKSLTNIAFEVSLAIIFSNLSFRLASFFSAFLGSETGGVEVGEV